MIRRNRVTRRALVVVSVIVLMMLASGAITTADTASSQQVVVSLPDAPPTPLINHQGYLLNPVTGEPVPDASYNATFELYAAEAGGTPIWGEKHQIVTRRGLFSVTLGTVAAIDPGIFDGNARWLSVSIDPDGELLPRIRVTHSPYAIFSSWAGAATSAHVAEVANLAADSERLGGNLPAAFAVAGHSHDTTNIVSGILHTDRYQAIEDLGAEGYLGNAAGDIALNNGVLQPKLNAELLNSQPASYYQNASNLNTGTLSTSLYSAYGDLVTDSRIGTGAGQVAAGDHVHDARYFTESESDTRYVNVSGDSMTGNLTVGKVVYSPAKTEYFTLSGEAFLPATDRAYNNSMGMGGAYLTAGSGWGVMTAPVNLPQEAFVMAATFHFYDNSPSNLKLSLDRMPLPGGSYVEMASVTTSGTPGYSSLTDTSISSYKVDNTTGALLIYVYCDAWDGNNLRVMGVTITYTIAEAH